MSLKSKIIEKLTKRATTICPPDKLQPRYVKGVVVMTNAFGFPNGFGEEIPPEILATELKELVKDKEVKIYYDRCLPSFVPKAYFEGRESMFKDYEDEF